MKAATIAEIKKELGDQNHQSLIALCLRLAKFKKENKELLTYLLFESHDEQSFVEEIIAELESSFAEINLSHVYYAKKSLRKILRSINKYCRYTQSSETEIAIRLHFCKLLKDTGLRIQRDKGLSKIYQSQLNKISGLIKLLHEDLQYDLNKKFESFLSST